ncbi:transcriptional regulator [Parafrankia sp. EUN1f]|uniref:transcriptional regulator n=1 Tax=Parafrankia sp. EUN1f TaxID=102897 RepID=UPI00030DE2BD|nr:helix-turn-helix domain-containing protein [Parafrankia sp. EUN1f]
MTTKTTEDRAYALALGGRLRAVRIQQGLSLSRVEEKSGGRFKAVVLGSYERADRSVTMARLGELAAFYGVPEVVLLPGASEPEVVLPPRIRFALPALAGAPAEAEPLRRWTLLIRRMRGDWAGRILTVRTADLVHIAAMLRESPRGAVGLMTGWGVLAAPVDLDSLEVELGNATGARR